MSSGSLASFLQTWHPSCDPPVLAPLTSYSSSQSTSVDLQTGPLLLSCSDRSMSLHLTALFVQGVILVAGPAQNPIIWGSKSHISFAVWYVHDVYFYHSFWRFSFLCVMGFYLLWSFAHGDIWFYFCFVTVDQDQVQLQYLKATLGFILVSLERVKLV